jgi:hypothetical protein
MITPIGSYSKADHPFFSLRFTIGFGRSSILFCLSCSINYPWFFSKRMDDRPNPSLLCLHIVENACDVPFTASAFPPFLKEYVLFFHENKSYFTSYGPTNAEGHESQRFSTMCWSDKKRMDDRLYPIGSTLKKLQYH